MRLVVFVFTSSAIALAAFWHQPAEALPNFFACTLDWKKLDPTKGERLNARSDRRLIQNRISEYHSYFAKCRSSQKRIDLANAEIARLRSYLTPVVVQPRPVTVKVRPTPSPPRPAPITVSPPPLPMKPALSPIVFLGGHGPEHASTFSEAIERVTEGGIIRVLPGRYRETARISKSVTIEGHRNAHSQPVFDGLVVIGEVDVRLEMIRFEGINESSTVRVEGARVDLLECTVLNSSRPQSGSGNPMTTAIFVPNGQVRIEGGTIGPGGNAAIIVSDHGKVVVRAATITGAGGYGLHASGNASAEIRDATTIAGAVAVEVSGEAKLVLNSTAVFGGSIPISVSSKVTPDIVNNRISLSRLGELIDATDENWLRIGDDVPRTGIKGNVSGSGRPLKPPRPTRRGASR